VSRRSHIVGTLRKENIVSWNEDLVIDLVINSVYDWCVNTIKFVVARAITTKEEPKPSLQSSSSMEDIVLLDVLFSFRFCPI
jgi:hypothetical protein